MIIVADSGKVMSEGGGKGGGKGGEKGAGRGAGKGRGTPAHGSVRGPLGTSYNLAVRTA